MKKSIILILFITLCLGALFTGCNEYKDNDENNAALHQEILPKGRKSDLDTITRLSEGEANEISNPSK